MVLKKCSSEDESKKFRIHKKPFKYQFNTKRRSYCVKEHKDPCKKYIYKIPVWFYLYDKIIPAQVEQKTSFTNVLKIEPHMPY